MKTLLKNDIKNYPVFRQGNFFDYERKIESIPITPAIIPAGAEVGDFSFSRR
jgi:hypothetical protein